MSDLLGRDRRCSELEAENAELRERADAHNKALLIEEREKFSALAELDEAAAKVAELEARLARYEADGPALMAHIGHPPTCSARQHDPWREDLCDCGTSKIDAAYREQHARCVAVVERELTKSAATAQQQPTPYWRGGEDAVRNVLAALTGEAP